VASFAAIGDDHEDAARKQRVHKKRDVDSVFKARHSSRLTAKEPDKFINMLSKAKVAKASRFNSSTGSPRLHAAALDTGFGADMVRPDPSAVAQGGGGYLRDRPCCYQGRNVGAWWS
jgi:hypothetical protein